MPKVFIYLDESGDLGWKFEAPYRYGGSSRYLTIASLVSDDTKRHLPKRLVTNLYKKFKWDPKIERKWSDMSRNERAAFADAALKLIEDHPSSIKYMAITVRKENVESHIRTDPNKLYNYMIGLSLVNEMAHHQAVVFVPDPRSIKVQSGNSLHDYLGMELWFKKEVNTALTTSPADSASNKNVQFSDMLSGVVQGHFEDGNSTPWGILRDKISYKTLFF